MTVLLSCFSDTNPRTATLVFDTLRVGFPAADVRCYWTGNNKDTEQVVKELCSRDGVKFEACEPYTTNDQIFNTVLPTLSGKVVLLDSDVVFWNEVESYEPEQLLSGRLIPRHFCSYVKMITEPRLHPSLLFINDVQELVRTMRSVSNSRFVPNDLISPVTVAVADSGLRFYDTMANMYGFIGGEAFKEDMLNHYDHLFCSSCAEDVSKSDPKFRDLQLVHNAVYSNPTCARGLWKVQEEYYNKHKI